MTRLGASLFLRSAKRLWTRRMGFIAIGGTVFFVLCYLAHLAVHEPEQLKSFPEHIVAGVIAVMLVTFGVERPLKRHYKDIQTLSLRQFTKEMGCAKKSIKILDIWMKSFLLSKGTRHFKKAVIAAVRDGIDVQILIAKPNSEAAVKRAQTLSENASEFYGTSATDILAMMDECIGVLESLSAEIDEMAGNPKLRLARNTLQIRLFDADIALAMYKIDDISYWNHFHYDKLSFEGEQYVTMTEHGPAGFMMQHFNKLWHDTNTVDISAFKILSVTSH